MKSPSTITHITSDTRAILWRYLFRNLMMPFRNGSTFDRLFNNGKTQGLMTTKMECSIRLFQWIVKYVHRLDSTDTVIHQKNLQFVHSFLSILKPAKSFRSFHVFFNTFKQMCDFLNIRYITNLETSLLITRTSSHNIMRVMRILCTLPNREGRTYYAAWAETSLMSERKIHMLVRKRSTWNNKNIIFNFQAAYIISECVSSIDDYFFTSDVRFGITSENYPEVCSQLWNEDATKNHGPWSVNYTFICHLFSSVDRLLQKLAIRWQPSFWTTFSSLLALPFPGKDLAWYSYSTHCSSEMQSCRMGIEFFMEITLLTINKIFFARKQHNFHFYCFLKISPHYNEGNRNQ